MQKHKGNLSLTCMATFGLLYCKPPVPNLLHVSHGFDKFRNFSLRNRTPFLSKKKRAMLNSFKFLGRTCRGVSTTLPVCWWRHLRLLMVVGSTCRSCRYRAIRITSIPAINMPIYDLFILVLRKSGHDFDVNRMMQKHVMCRYYCSV